MHAPVLHSTIRAISSHWKELLSVSWARSIIAANASISRSSIHPVQVATLKHCRHYRPLHHEPFVMSRVIQVHLLVTSLRFVLEDAIASSQPNRSTCSHKRTISSV